jgi:hypothetical protein
MRVRCQICFEWIAEVSRSFLSYPMTGAMFKSPDTHHGVEPPFPVSATWEHMRCPYGAHRPFIKDDEIQTDEGMITLPKDGSRLVYKVEREILTATAPPPLKMTKALNRKDFSTERTVKKRELIKEDAEDVHVRGVRQGIQDSKGKGRVPGKGKAEVFTCETCEKEFDKEINLNRHKRMAHKGV